MANTLKLGAGKWATGTDTVLAFNDENNNIKPLPFNFSRASSATVVNQSGLIETVGSGEPRIDFSNDAKGALLLEPTRTNAIQYSEDFTQWTSTNVTVNSNVGLAPDGTLNADRLTFDGTTNARVETTAQGIDIFEGTKHRPNSVWLKTESGTTTVQIGSSGAWLSTVTVTEEWQRFTHISRQAFARIKSDNATSVLAWGYQFETNGDIGLSYATSYIPTSGQSGGVTRVADSSSQTVSSNIITQSEGTLYWNGDLNNLANYSNIISLSGGSGSWIYLLSYSAGLSFEIKSNFSTSLSFNPSGYTEGSYKVAISYSGSEAVIYINGILVHTDSSVVIPSFSTLNIGQWSGYGEAKNTKEIKLYNTRLSNAELASLTTI